MLDVKLKIWKIIVQFFTHICSMLIDFLAEYTSIFWHFNVVVDSLFCHACKSSKNIF